MQNAPVSNPNDYKVVSFHNSTDFGFTPELGCMYDGRPINGKNGSPGIDAGETMVLPYHVAHQLATNLAKIAITKSAPSVDPAGIPTGVPLWDTEKLTKLKMSYLTDLYTEDKPTEQSATDKLMAKVEEYRLLVEKLVPGGTTPVVEQPKAEGESVPTTVEPTVPSNTNKAVYQDKAEVLTELEVRGIKHDKRKSKDELEKLLA